MKSNGMKIVARYLSKKVVKGRTADFNPDRRSFHIIPMDVGFPVKIDLEELKAVFFVKRLEGKGNYHERKEFVADDFKFGRRIRVTFIDGETLSGSTFPMDPTPYGFFMVPVDPDSNNDKIFVVNASIKNFEVL